MTKKICLRPGMLAKTLSILRPVVSILLCWKYRNIAYRTRLTRQRRGIYQIDRAMGPLIWVNAASIGEMKSALPLTGSLTNQYRLLFTTVTVSSQRLLLHWLRKTRTSHSTTTMLGAVDLPVWIGRFLDRWSPSVVVSIESEIWPNLLECCRNRFVPVIVLNGRLSARSFARWRVAGNAFKSLAGNFKVIHARSFLDCARFQLLGGDKSLIAAGDLKFLGPPLDYNETELWRIASSLLCRPVWLAASTHPGEEDLVLQIHEALRTKYSGLISIIVPRHPERGVELSRQLGVRRRSLGKASPQAGVWIADTYGELGLWYRMISIVFVGRSLTPNGGGQNMLEPARLGCAVVVGPETANFVDLVKILKEANAIEEIQDPGELMDFVALMLSESYFRKMRGEYAAKFVANLKKPSMDLFLRTIQSAIEQ